MNCFTTFFIGAAIISFIDGMTGTGLIMLVLAWFFSDDAKNG